MPRQRPKEAPAGIYLSEDFLPCGCWMATCIPLASDPPVKAFICLPCSFTCKYYLYAMSESSAQGKPVEFRMTDPGFR